MTYTAPVRDMLFTLDAVAGIDDLARLPVYHEVTPDLTATCWRRPAVSPAKCWRP